MTFCDLDKNMEVAEQLVKYTIQQLLNNSQEDLEFFNKWVDKQLIKRLQTTADSKSPFERITYREAIALLQKEEEKGKAKFEHKPEYGGDLQVYFELLDIQIRETEW